ncbi:MAG: DNA repair protein RecN [Sphaerochaetaceae bacterium]|nr:DNA repair protein RecN [Sphaerochaetaceae bacterium]MDC7237054.1 DNA repair protein RecN [Sphaerochaetaceae bacterium]MDC7250967.1 DNA repair protein RecN [Sphaerochaetaceae bacterium]
MLECLDIHAFKLIEDIHIDFKDGFSVITGETGAGKSIMLSALSLLSGAKGEAASIRNGFDSATVTGQFYINSNDKELVSFLEENNIDYCDDTLIVKRIIKTNGRTLSYINNEAINRNLLMQLSTYLIDISAQHAHQSIMKSSKQLFLLDSYGENFEFLDEYKEAYQRVKDLENQKSEIENIINSSKQQEDYLKYAFEEINSVDPKENEDEELSDKIRRISQFEQIHDNISYIINILGNSYEGASTINNLENCNELLDKVGRKDDTLRPLASRIKSCTLEIEDIYETLKDYLDNMQYSQVELDQMQSRLAQLQKIKKKYGPSLSSVIEFKNNIDSKLSALTNGEDDIIFIEKKLNKAKAELKDRAYALSARRKKSSLKLATSIEKTLKKLGMKHASFAVDLKTKDFHLDGIDSVDFLMSANPGIEKRSIKEIASGGELSRVMLAIKTTLSEKDKVSILVFDEVDAGIGGEVATNVAQALLDLAATSQVIAITHLASIASKAHSHLMVKKYVEHDLSFTSIVELNNEERVSEIARMLSGDSNSKVSIEHAKALLD